MYWTFFGNLYHILQRKWGDQCSRRSHLVLSALLAPHPNANLAPQGPTSSFPKNNVHYVENIVSSATSLTSLGLTKTFFQYFHLKVQTFGMQVRCDIPSKLGLVIRLELCSTIKQL